MAGFTENASKAIRALKTVETGEVILIHHDDADGVASGAVIRRALEREGFRVRSVCLEKVYPEVIEFIHSKDNQILFYSDIGSSHADLISEFNANRNLVIILDHHDPVPATDPKVIDLNLELYGPWKGETDFAGATCCYLFAKALNKGNVDLSYLALTGSCEIPGELGGFNKEALDEAIEAGVTTLRGRNILINKFGITTRELFKYLQILSSVGYYQGGPEMATRLALNGMTEEIRSKIKELEVKRKNANKRLIYILYRKRLRKTEHVQWFNDEDVYAGMGTKTIGTFCSMLSFRGRLIDPNKYVMGMMRVPREVPGYGLLSKDFMKVSVRAPKPMQELIDADKIPSAVELLKRATGGFGLADGHAYAASAVIERDRLDQFLAGLETVIEKHKEA